MIFLNRIILETNQCLNLILFTIPTPPRPTCSAKNKIKFWKTKSPGWEKKEDVARLVALNSLLLSYQGKKFDHGTKNDVGYFFVQE